MTAPTSTDHHLADDTKCLHGGCRKPGARHHWGHGFTFCDTHMPTLIDLEHGRLVSRRKLGRPGICRDCREFRGIKGRGLCPPCYHRNARRGTLDNHEMTRWHTAGKG